MHNNSIARRFASFRDLWSLVVLTGIALLLVVIAIWMLASQYDFQLYRSQSTQNPLGVSQLKFTDETGIKILRVTSTAGGGMVDLAYQVVDPDKAIVVHDDENPPGFIVEATGQLINTPYHDHSIFEAHTAVTYHELIMNAAGALKPGTLITIVVGESRLEHVTVQ